MTINPLFCISPVDGRYEKKVTELRTHVSEYGLMYYRVLVEINWLKNLSFCKKITEVPLLSNHALLYLDNIISKFDLDDAEEIKTIEKTTNHDVKAVEYFIKNKLSNNLELKKISEFVHFACTSEDINNISYALMLKNTINKFILPSIEKALSQIKNLAIKYKDQAMLSRTHGQPASPTTLGKEMSNFYLRIKNQLSRLKEIRYLAKINGAVGNFNAHYISYPEVDWLDLSQSFIKSLDLEYNALTAQIEPHDFIAECFDCLSRINTIFIDFNRDIWGYISINYFSQKTVEGEIGSSTMPHKVNPIDFENAEGNLGMANAIMHHLSSKLPISRWQRDLTDSTVLRNLGMGLAYSYISYAAMSKGIEKLQLNKEVLLSDLENNIEVLGEAIQTVMRRYKISNPYEKIKELTRGRRISSADLANFVDSINELPDQIKNKLKTLIPKNYTGIADQLVDKFILD